jgi:protein O-GlcNAc transferase
MNATARFVALVRILLWLQVVCLSQPDGPASFERGKKLFESQQYDAAAIELWKAVLFHGAVTDPHRKYDVNMAFRIFLQCYAIQDRMADGLAFVASESFQRGQLDMGHNYLEQALETDPNNPLALQVREQYAPIKELSKMVANNDDEEDPLNSGQDGTTTNSDLQEQTPEQLYEIAAAKFSAKDYEECADVAEISCLRSLEKLGPSCSNAVYCRSILTDFGYNGTQFDADMKRIETIITKETKERRSGNLTHFFWRQASSVHPHMLLGYPVNPQLKRFAAESVAFLDEKMARFDSSTGGITPLPTDLPYTYPQPRRMDDGEKIRIGFVGSGFCSKAVLYLSQDMFRFFDRSSFEVHIFSFGPPDNDRFIKVAMGGVDWRQRVIDNVDAFHDMQQMSSNHVEAARFIHHQNIHILIEWDGYARQGVRAQGLFALRPAPIQILHQEYLGTSGATYVDYLLTDPVASPPELQYLYTEKLIYLPNHFFSKGHYFQTEVLPPTFEYAPQEFPYRIGTGSPVENKCLANTNANVSFVFCNFNKLLKANPETIRSWIRILRNVPDSFLCLLENPVTGIVYFRRFLHEAAGTTENGIFVPGDGDALNNRIHFLPWENNPFDYQKRNQDMCNVMLDSHPYNGHTVAQDSLYAGVPIVTRSDGRDMSSLVTTSANRVLGLEFLNAKDGPSQYEEIAIRLGTDHDFYHSTRSSLIQTCLQRFFDGLEPDHIFVQETDEAKRGTFDVEIAAHPQDPRSTARQSESRL